MKILKEIPKSFLREWKSTTFLILLIPIWIGLAQEFYTWLNTDENATWIKQIYNLLNNLWLVNIPICIFIGYFAYKFYNKTWTDRNFRPFRPLLAIMALIVLCYKNDNIVYANIIFGFKYLHFFIILSALTIIIEFIKFINNKRTDETKDIKGFSTDEIYNGDISDDLKEYATTITNKLIATDTSKESYAIGITGEWGVGKTKFLNCLESNLKDKAEVITFNPWMCRTPEQLTQDFFASLIKQLSPKYSTLSKSIKDYAKNVSIKLAPHSGINLNMIFPTKTESLYEKKQNLSEKLKALPYPIVVLIDDIDRLEREEIFEVLRLIRNTADLSNMIYLVAYDKEYVTCVLEEKNIKNASAYLEKIFQVEIPLPKVEKHLIWETLLNDINIQDDTKYNLKKLISSFDYEERDLILRVLCNYRQAKRFSRLYMTNVSYLDRNGVWEISAHDLFWLDLLQVYDKQTYDILKNSPLSLLSCNNRLSIRSEIKKAQNNGEKFGKEETLDILHQMFNSQIKPRRGSICLVENLDKYFALNVSPFKLSIKELNKMLKEKDTETVINDWGNKDPASVVYQLKQINIKELKEKKLKSFLKGILFLGMKNIDKTNMYAEVIKEFLNKAHYEKDKEETIHDFVLSWMDEKCKKDEDVINTCMLLKKLYIPKHYDDNNNLEKTTKNLVITNPEIEGLLSNSMTEYLSRHPESKVLDVLTEGSTIEKLLKNCSVISETYETYYYNTYKQNAISAVIDFFSKKEEKPTKEEFERAYDAFFYYEIPKDEDPYESTGEPQALRDIEIEQHFGDSKNIELFKAKCFA